MVTPAKPGLTLNAEDFEQLDYAVFCTNTLTHTKVNEPNLIKIIEFIENGLVLQIPRNTCAEGHPLALSIFPHPTRKTLVELTRSKELQGMLEITSKVKKLERDGNTQDRITLEFYQVNLIAWKKFTQSYSDRQLRLDAIVKSMREE